MLLVGAGDYDQAVEALRHARFENERGFHDGDRMTLLPSDLFHPLFLAANHRGMHDAVQFVDAGWACGFAEGSLRELGAVHAAVGIKNRAAEMVHHFVVHRLAGQHELMGDVVRLDEMRAKCDQHLADYGFARRDSAGEPDFQHSSVGSGQWPVASNKCFVITRFWWTSHKG